MKGAEKPKACLRRELIEELGCRVPRLVRLGDWLHRSEQQRVFGCEIEKPIDTFDAEELRAIGWFSYEEVAELAVARQVADGLRARRHQRVSALARRPSLTATVHRRRLPPLMESHVIKYLPSAERAVRMLSIRSSQSPLASFGRTALTWLAPTSIGTGGFLS